MKSKSEDLRNKNRSSTGDFYKKSSDTTKSVLASSGSRRPSPLKIHFYYNAAEEEESTPIIEPSYNISTNRRSTSSGSGSGPPGGDQVEDGRAVLNSSASFFYTPTSRTRATTPTQGRAAADVEVGGTKSNSCSSTKTPRGGPSSALLVDQNKNKTKSKSKSKTRYSDSYQMKMVDGAQHKPKLVLHVPAARSLEEKNYADIDLVLGDAKKKVR